MVGESNQNVFLIQIAASSFAEFEISEFEISRVDCMWMKVLNCPFCHFRLCCRCSIWRKRCCIRFPWIRGWRENSFLSGWQLYPSISYPHNIEISTCLRLKFSDKKKSSWIGRNPDCLTLKFIIKYDKSRAPDKVHKMNFNRLYLCYFFIKSMFDHLLESSHL